MFTLEGSASETLGCFNNKLYFYSKGFAYGIDFDEHSSSLSCIVDHIIDHFGDHPEPCLAFDGDNLSCHSFTHVIPNVVQCNPHIEVWGFVKNQRELTRFTNSWMHSGISDIHVYAFEDVNNFVDLGIMALKYTSADHVVCCGGGECILNEYERARSLAKFKVIPVSRRNKKTGEIEHCILDSFMEAIPMNLMAAY